MRRIIALPLFFCAVLCTTPVIAEQTPRAVVTDGRIKTVRWSPDEVYTLKIALRFSTCIEFSKTETIKSLQFGDTKAWDVEVDENVLCLKSGLVKAGGNLFVATDKRRYPFALVSIGRIEKPDDRRLTYGIRFSYPEENRKTTDTRTAAVAGEAAIKNDKYSFKKNGPNAPVPTQVYSDDKFTRFSFQQGRIPNIYVVEPNGKMVLASAGKDGDMRVVKGIYRLFVLTASEDEKDWTCIFNDNLPKPAPSTVMERTNG